MAHCNLEVSKSLDTFHPLLSLTELFWKSFCSLGKQWKNPFSENVIWVRRHYVTLILNGGPTLSRILFKYYNIRYVLNFSWYMCLSDLQLSVMFLRMHGLQTIAVISVQRVLYFTMV